MTEDKIALRELLEKVSDAASGTIGIRLDLPNPKRAIPAGRKCQARFTGVSGADLNKRAASR
ncbi:MAG TPA: hypothetical protein VND95_11255 [Stellaceae bacterium]|nr:hypothetical protein [Stellaceae bacterium]